MLAVRGKMSRRRRYGVLQIGVTVVLAAAAMCILVFSRSEGNSDHNNHANRRLSAAQCDSSYEGIEWKTCIYFIVILYSFLGLAIVCDDFFAPSLDKISEVLKLSPDVAGATFLAAGSSAPELFTSVGDAFGPGNSIGMGTIVGSAMFNILVIVALSCAVAGGVLQIDWRPVIRDVCFYSFSIILLNIFFSGDVVEWWEGLIMTCCYFLYIGFMCFNQRVFAMCPGSSSTAKVYDDDSVKNEEIAAAQKTAEALANGSANEKPQQPSEGEAAAGSSDASDNEDGGRFDWPDNPAEQVLFVFSYPFLVAFTYTIPDCENDKWERFYSVSFIISIIWIGGLCYLMVDFASRIACMLHVSPIVMGQLVLSVGTSVPDAIGSMIAAKAGEADMAVANAIGSNVFDILLGLGFPWFLSGLFNKTEGFPVVRCGLTLNLGILFGTVILFLLILLANKFKMSPSLGWGLLALYICYVVYVIVVAATDVQLC